jgi:hypothetical protein
MSKKQQPKKPDPANEWRPYENPAFEINGLGQLRTKNHKPGDVPTKPKQPLVEEGTLDDWTGVFADGWTITREDAC